jgi:hypothetical protein
MVEYRAYIMSDDHIVQAVDLECPDDDAAKDRAKKLVDGPDVELWQLGPKVGTFKHRE